MCKIKVSLILILLSTNAFGFNWSKCKRYLNKDNSLTGGAAFASTSSFFTSTGECAMIGELEHDKKVFFAHNFEKMKEEFAKGRGEYSASFAHMHGCGLEGQMKYSLLMKRHVGTLLRLEQKVSDEKLFFYIESIFEKDHFLKSECSFKNETV